ncbi:WSTF/Acf1/Cbp [Parasponia andersonii]|uniref:WSTF/Acf1/Cbp n=1 Tax=Parasponia andersonii TaxID=3476 RepID=A0A2P5BIW2_PARAD|nr:WSTF/Acf1/Cbp [Parasponia andersonii]
MPLLKRKPFLLAQPPKDLEPHELLFQVRFTKEIFRDYNEYLNRINLYRQRVWTCKVTGKINLTYEEALVSEKRATEKVQQFPKELVVPALRIIQYSMLSLKDLADTISAKLQDHVFVGAELYARKDTSEYLCRIVKVLEEGDTVRYKVAWLDRNKKVVETSFVKREDLIQKKLPFSRNVWKSFIRESTYRSAPWILHEKLAQKHGISTELPQDLRSKVFLQNGLIFCAKKRKKNQEGKNNDLEGKDEHGKSKRKAVELKEDVHPSEEPIKYPIDDLLVQPGADDPVFTDRPVPLRDFNVPMECVGDLLLVWDFCSSFGRLLNLSPYSLEDFENAICHKETNVILLVETHSALMRLLIKDSGQYLLAVQKRNRKIKITLINWTEYLCDLLEIVKIPETGTCTSTIKRGHYGLLDAHAKLGILRELVNHVLETDTFREKLDEFIEQRQALGATKRGEALEEARKKREIKERLKAESDANGAVKSESVESLSANGSPIRQNGDKVKKQNGEVFPSEQDDALGKSESNKSDTASKKMNKKLDVDVKMPTENGKDSSNSESKQSDTLSKKMANRIDIDVKMPTENGKDSSIKEKLKPLKDDLEEGMGRRNKEQRKEYYEREMEKRFVRTSPLGKDKHHNRYWWFRRDGRIFVESPDSKQWGYYGSKEELDALMGSLNCKGVRERALRKQLETYYSRISNELQRRTKDLTHKIALEEAVVRRSTRVRAPPRENPVNAFLRYVNKWKED